MLAVIGGTGFSEFMDLADVIGEVVATPHGDSYIEKGELRGVPLVFLPRHGHPPRFPPHRINYRSNIQALADQGVDGIVAVNAVGSVDTALGVPELVIPDQIIDYTWGREHTFYDDEIHHVDITYPFDPDLRQALVEAAAGLPVRPGGVLGCTQGPRLETAAEIVRLRNDGCHVVGMTSMPEAGLARERDIPYAGLCVVVNAGAGINDSVVELADIQEALDTGMGWVRDIIGALSQARI